MNIITILLLILVIIIMFFVYKLKHLIFEKVNLKGWKIPTKVFL